MAVFNKLICMKMITIKNLEVVGVDNTNNQLLIKGAIPGRRGTLVEVIG